MNHKFLLSSEEEVLSEVRSDYSGLFHDEVKLRVKRDGKNEILVAGLSIWRIFFSQYANFLMLLLIIGAALSFYLGEQTDGLVLVAVLLINGILGTYQEYKAERLSRVLNKHLPQNVKVRRENKESIVNREDLVVGDIVLLEIGQMVPADLRIIKSYGVLVDESILTGESAGVAKSSERLHTIPKSVTGMTNILFKGTIVLNGSCEGVVVAAGAATEFGQVISFTNHTKKRSSFLRQINELSSFLFKMTVITSSALFLVLWFLKPELGVNHIFLFAIALAIAIVPEMLPLISTIALSRASLLLMKRGVLIKRLSSLEDLGAVEILCVDKTGTITKNILTVREIVAPKPDKCLHYAIMASNVTANKDFVLSGSFDVAIRNRANKQVLDEADEGLRIWEESFDPKYKWQFNVISNNGFEMAIKGAPEAILDKSSVPANEKERLLHKVASLGRKGLRVLAVAKATMNRKERYSSEDIKDLDYLGLIVFEDPIKHTAKLAIKQAELMGIKIKILTGDAPEVAMHVAQEAGIMVAEHEVLTGTDLQDMGVSHRIEAIKNTKIFARVNPQQKYEILQVFNQHHSVMFLGEGINDAPAIKSADVGMVVEEASDIAKETADIVLTKPDLGVIIESIYLGRQIMHNIAKYILITLTGNFGSLYGLGLISTVSPILPLLPTQVLLENILTDVPMIGVVNNKINAQEQQKPFRQNIREIGFAATILGLAMMLIQFVFYQMFRELPTELFRTLWLIEIVLLEFTLIISLRTTDWFWRASILSVKSFVLFVGVIALTLALPFIPWLGQALYLVPYQFEYLIPIGMMIIAGIIMVEIGKRVVFRNKSFNNHN